MAASKKDNLAWCAAYNWKANLNRRSGVGASLGYGEFYTYIRAWGISLLQLQYRESINQSIPDRFTLFPARVKVWGFFFFFFFATVRIRGVSLLDLQYGGIKQ